MPRINHTAILVNDIHETLSVLPVDCVQGEIEEFKSEGTKEVYVNSSGVNASSLLLIQAIGPGPYQSSSQNRGPGLHHICITVEEITSYGDELMDKHLFLHPLSLKTIKRNIIWLCRPGIPFLIEVVQNVSAVPVQPAYFVKHVEVPMDSWSRNIVNGILGNFVIQSTDAKTRLHLCNSNEPIVL